jgi:hypothetical protein
MKRQFRALTLPALALCSLLSSGCGSSTTNEEAVVNTRAPGAENAPVYKSYGEKMIKDSEEAAKQRAAAKGAKGQPAPTPPASSEAPKK